MTIRCEGLCRQIVHHERMIWQVTYPQRQRRRNLKLTAMAEALLGNWDRLSPEFQAVLREAGVYPRKEIAPSAPKA